MVRLGQYGRYTSRPGMRHEIPIKAGYTTATPSYHYTQSAVAIREETIYDTSAKAECEAVIQPNRMTDDLWSEPVTMVDTFLNAHG